MKISFQVVLPSIYAMYCSTIMIYLMSCDVGFNTLTIMLYITNFTVVYTFYKIGGLIDEWLKK